LTDRAARIMLKHDDRMLRRVGQPTGQPVLVLSPAYMDFP
jgi:hypothetical protein